MLVGRLLGKWRFDEGATGVDECNEGMGERMK